MADFVKLNEANVVIAVHTVDNTALDSTNIEQSGITFLNSLHGDANWKLTSSTIRGTYGWFGMIYNPTEDIFITLQPFLSWTRTGSFWNAPTPMPVVEGKRYQWNEPTVSWQEVI